VGNGKQQIKVARRSADTHQDARADSASHSSAQFGGGGEPIVGGLVPLRLAARPGLLGTQECPSVRRSPLVGGLFHFLTAESTTYVLLLLTSHADFPRFLCLCSRPHHK
jgi:hypothetical protein